MKHREPVSGTARRSRPGRCSPCVASALAVAGAAVRWRRSRGRQHHQDRRVRLADRQGGDLRPVLPQGHRSSPIEELNAAGGVLGKQIELITEDNRSTAGRVGHHREEADHARQGGGHPRRGGVGPLARSRADRAGEPDSDDLAVVHQSEGHRDRRLHLPRLLHRSLPGQAAGRVRQAHAQGAEGRDLLGRRRALQRRPRAVLPRAVRGRRRADRLGAEVHRRRQGFQGAAHRHQGHEARCDHGAGLLHRRRA